MMSEIFSSLKIFSAEKEVSQEETRC